MRKQLQRNLCALGALLACALAWLTPANAQNTTGLVVSVCGSPVSPFVAGRPGPFTVDTTGKLCDGFSGGGGPVTIANGADVAQGSTTDSPAATPTSGTAATEIALLKALVNAMIAATPAGELHIGEVGSNATAITNALITSNNTVTTGKALGPLQTVAGAVRVSGSIGASGTSGYIQNVTVTFSDAVGSGPLDVYYFSSNPSGSTCTDNTTFVLAAADRDKVIAIVHVTDFTASNAAAIGQAANQSMLFSVSASTSIFACVVSRGSFAITGTSNASLISKIVRN